MNNNHILGRPSYSPTSTISGFIRGTEHIEHNHQNRIESHIELENNVPMDIDIEPITNDE